MTSYRITVERTGEPPVTFLLEGPSYTSVLRQLANDERDDIDMRAHVPGMVLTIDRHGPALDE